MESIKENPTPREALFLVKKTLGKVLTDEHAFYSKLSTFDEGAEIEETEIDSMKSHYNELFTETVPPEETEGDEEDESDEVAEKINYIEVLTNKLAALESEINKSLETNDFTTLATFVDNAGETLQSEPAEAAIADPEIKMEGNISILNNMYSEYLDEVSTLLSRIDEEREFDLT